MVGPCCLMRFKSLRENLEFGFGGAVAEVLLLLLCCCCCACMRSRWG